MKIQEREAKRNLTTTELAAELRQSQEKLFRLQFKHSSSPVPNPLEIRQLRRHVARLSTWIREKSVAAAGAALSPGAPQAKAVSEARPKAGVGK